MQLLARESRLADVGDLAPRLRQADLQEIQANSGVTAREALVKGFALSDPCFTIVTAEDEPRIVGMFGAAPSPIPGIGYVWLLGTDDLAKSRISFLRQSRYWVEELQKQYPILINFVDVRNTEHIKWLKWLGAQFEEPKPLGVEGRDFVEFYIK